MLVLGLGCENSGVEEIQKRIPKEYERRIRYLVCQQADDEIEAGMKLLNELADGMRGEKRTACSVSKLVIGLKCGGSDGFSGITANPVIGGFADLLTAQGGSVILTEVPEMFGAETLLMERCESRELFDKTVSLINDFKRYFEENHQTVYENPLRATRPEASALWRTRRWAAPRRADFLPCATCCATASGRRFRG